MKNWLMSKMFGFIGQKLDGYKTKIGGIALILLGVVGIVGEIFPNQGLPVTDFESSCASIAAGIAALGLGHKAEKVKAAITAPQPVATPDVAPPNDWVPGLCPEEEERTAPEPKPEQKWDGKTPGQFR